MNTLILCWFMLEWHVCGTSGPYVFHVGTKDLFRSVQLKRDL